MEWGGAGRGLQGGGCREGGAGRGVQGGGCREGGAEHLAAGGKDGGKRREQSCFRCSIAGLYEGEGHDVHCKTL
jgi:hypothetical protein